jgi:hypothetical protein
MEQTNQASDGSKDLSKELWREYQFGAVTYRIVAPVRLWTGKTTHRVLDADGVVHCVPAVGEYNCVLRWQPRNAAEPVQF